MPRRSSQDHGHHLTCTVHEVRIEPQPGRDPRLSIRVALLYAIGVSAGWYRVAPAFAPQLWTLHEDNRVVGRRWMLCIDADGYVSELHDIQ